MTTDALIDALAARGRAKPARSVRLRYAAALGAGVAVTAIVTLSTLGPRHDFGRAIELPMFWVKLAFVASLAVLGALGAFRAGLPGRRVSALARAIVGVLGGIWILAASALAESAPADRAALLLGDTWRTCPWLVAGLSIPVLVALAWAMRRMAPTHLRRAGALAGFASGASAALVYALHCPELAAPFIGTWYVLGMLIPTLAGALLGERIFRW
jgi:hypothetical protein